ncbi:MAG: hypothetical protein K9W46_13140 [Candidatus Heimdallarchaeum endolithica]|uniref:Ig-like domain-containing protein n=1 Tax=Candidatus Heimdallarchaeum endolithica TaxID=2876572 RepID=A0A9Y1FNV6_9ARCH|nr:MAG: hypothetical protein K9W46_13140 [Candidatus Heimdallarchaeum endolithica]
MHRSPFQPEESLIVNQVENGEMEEENNIGIPKGFSAFGSPFIRTIDNYTSIVANGSYSGYIKSQATNIASASGNLRLSLDQSPYAYVSDMITVSFYYYIIDNYGSDNDFYFSIRFSNDRYLYYFLSYHGAYGSNNSNNGVFDINTTEFQTWKLFSRNVTEDYLAIFGSYTTEYIQHIYFRCYAAQYSYNPVEVVIDTVNITDSSDNDYMSNYNGNFENGDGSYWIDIDSDPSFVSLTDEHYSGNKAVNITAKFIQGLNSHATFRKYFGNPQGLYVYKENSLLIDFYWKIKFNLRSYDEYASFIIHFSNNTVSYYIEIVLGIGDKDFSLYSNYSSNSNYYYYIKDDGFGREDEWVHTSIDVYELYNTLNLRNITLENVDFYIGAYSQNTRVELLIDNLSIKSYAFIEPSFEQIWDPSRIFAAWETSASENCVNKTSFAHSGDWAINISSHSNYAVSTYISNMYFILKPGMISNFWYYLEKMQGDNVYVSISLLLDDTNSIHYVIANGSNINLSNQTDVVYFLLKDRNILNNWLNLKRNIYNDAISYYGVNNWNVTRITLNVDTTGTDVMTVIFDDLNLIEIGEPVIESVSLTNTPKYYQGANIVFDAYDELSDITELTLNYYNGSSWLSVIPTKVSEKGYEVNLPTLPTGTHVLFYINATDLFGNIQTDDNGGVYYSFTVIDDIEPSIELIRPYNNSLLTETVLLEANAEDEGSSIAFIEFYANLTLITNISSSPYETYWNTRNIGNGVYELKAIAYDSSGNYRSTSDKRIVTVENDFNPPLLSHIEINPSKPEYGEEVEVIVGVSEETSVKNCTLYYKFDDGNWQSTSMTSSGSLYYAYIPPVNWSTEVFYYVVAFDEFEQVSTMGFASDPYSYIATDTVLPNLVVDGPPTSTVLSGDNIKFNINGSDDGSGVAKLEVEINNTIWTANSIPQTYYLNTTSLDNGEYTIYFRLSDRANNTIEIQLVFQIHNPKGFFPKSWSAIDSVLNSYYGIAVGAATVILGIGINSIVKTIRSKKKGRTT